MSSVVLVKKKKKIAHEGSPLDGFYMLLLIEVSANEQHQIDSQSLGSAAAFQFLLDCLAAAGHEHGSV